MGEAMVGQVMKVDTNQLRTGATGCADAAGMALSGAERLLEGSLRKPEYLVTSPKRTDFTQPLLPPTKAMSTSSTAIIGR